MAYQDIIYTVEDYIATITLNRPETLNAFTGTMIDEWVEAIETAKTDPKVRVLVVTGAGRGFCSGMDMASMADIRIMSDKARVGMTYVRMGLLPGDAGCYFLPRIVGIAKACELIWSGRMIDAEEALRIGYVSKVVPHDELAAATKEFGAQFTQAAVATQFAKRLIWRGIDMFRNINLEMAEMAMAINATSPDTREGPRAWVEKREPEWTAE